MSAEQDGKEESPPEGGRRRRRFLPLRRRSGPRQRRRLPFDLKKALFILPNAFTASSIFCGLYAVFTATEEGADTYSFYKAAIAIFFAGFFDMFDGRVARMTKTQSDFGVQFDSLADVMSFGVAPSVLVYKWALGDLGLTGMVVSATFALCGAIRLARFNVLAQRGEGSSSWFIGLPIPVAAAMVVSLVIAQTKTLAEPVQAKGSVIALTLVLGYLMVSNVRYYTFKTYRPSLRTVPFMIAGAVIALFITFTWHASVVLVAAIGGYIFLGLMAEVVLFNKRKVNDPIKGPQAKEAAAH
jgi:CDP-diacylglycerol--serine O-phosphatidyltransferase